MAEGHRMTAAELVDKLLADEHADVLRDSVACHPRAISSGHQRYIADSHGHSTRTVDQDGAS
jgi:hypothetical protein